MKEINRIIAKNLSHYMDVFGMTQLELADKLSCSNTTVSSWIQGNATPRMDKIDKMCEIFSCTRSDLVSDTQKTSEEIQNDVLDNQVISDFRSLNDSGKLRLMAYMQLLKKEDKNQ